MEHITCTTIHDYNKANVKVVKICYVVDMTNKCVVGFELNSLNEIP